MSKPQNSERYQYEHSPSGKLQAYIRRFHNITELSNAFEQSEDFPKADKLRVDMEADILKQTEMFSEVEKIFVEQRRAYEAQVKAMLLKMLSETVDILKNFEQNYGNK